MSRPHKTRVRATHVHTPSHPKPPPRNSVRAEAVRHGRIGIQAPQSFRPDFGMPFLPSRAPSAAVLFEAISARAACTAADSCAVSPSMRAAFAGDSGTAPLLRLPAASCSGASGSTEVKTQPEDPNKTRAKRKVVEEREREKRETDEQGEEEEESRGRTGEEKGRRREEERGRGRVRNRRGVQSAHTRRHTFCGTLEPTRVSRYGLWSK